MGDIHDDLREVMGLLGKATPGPWYSEMGASRQQHVRGKSRNVNRAPARIATLGSPRAYQSDVEIEDEANARLIVAAVNLLKEHGPALLARQEGEWLPIESAPRDRPVIITNGDAVGEASYQESDGGWWWAGYHPTDAADGYVWQPSHWRPLPALPAARSGGGG